MPRRADGTVCYSDTHYLETWRAMEALVDQGLVRAIGLSNFSARQMDDVIAAARHRPAVNQVEDRPAHRAVRYRHRYRNASDTASKLFGIGEYAYL